MDERADLVLPALAPAIRVDVAIGCPALLCGYVLVWGHSALRPAFERIASASLLLAAAEGEGKYLPSLTSVSADQSIPRECSLSPQAGVQRSA